MKNKNSYDALIIKGEKTRETGHPKQALKVFDHAIEVSKDDVEKSDAMRHKGLCFEHLDDLYKALGIYDEAFELAKKAQDKSAMARVLRHKSSCFRKQQKFEKAITLSEEGRGLMLEVDPTPTDLCWVTHGVVQALIEGKKSKKQVLKWGWFEFKDLLYMLPREKNIIRRRVWFTGWLMDMYRAFGVIAFPLRVIAYLISWKSNLGLRKSQIKKGKT